METNILILIGVAMLIGGANGVDIAAVLKGAPVKSTIMFHFFRGLIFLSFMIVGGVFAIPLIVLFIGLALVIGILFLVFLTLDWVVGRIRRMFGAARAKRAARKRMDEIRSIPRTTLKPIA